jgi:hypothetical protein
MGMDSDQAWVSLKQAALRLGLSEKTIRRRVEAGRLEGRKMSTPTGPAWLIRVDDVQPMMLREGVGTGTVLPTPAAGLVEALALIERQQQQITEMAGRIGYYQAELEQARGRLAALEAPKEEKELAQPCANFPAAPDPAPRRWWQRILFG